MGNTELVPKCSECKKYLRHEVPAPFVEPLHIIPVSPTQRSAV